MFRALIIASFAAGLVGCAMADSRTTGIFYTNTSHGEMVLPGSGTKKGMACQTSILGVYASGDASVEAAKKAGGITKVTGVDATAESILGFYAKYCTVVRGS
jgi:hypothetical protein